MNRNRVLLFRRRSFLNETMSVNWREWLLFTRSAEPQTIKLVEVLNEFIIKSHNKLFSLLTGGFFNNFVKRQVRKNTLNLQLSLKILSCTK